MTGYEAKAVEVKQLRDRTGAGMMDAKRALRTAGGDMDGAARWLREQGLAQTRTRAGRESGDGTVALATDGNVAAVVELRSETDFVAKSPDFRALADEMARAVVDEGEEAAGRFQRRLDDLKVALKENLALGRVVRVDAAPGNLLDSYLHVQSERGVNAVVVELAGGSREVAHDVAVHIAFARPAHVSRDEFPPEVVAGKRDELETLSRNEGKPEAALTKIVEGRLGGFFKSVPGGALLDQPFVKDEKRPVGEAVGEARVVRFVQVEIGG
ncbi:MAG: translation elongation factor Ts [Acidimicrobiales bacterium]